MSYDHMPTTGPLTDWLRNEARKPFDLPRGDIDEQFPLHFLGDQTLKDASLAGRVADAVEKLLAENDLKTSRVLLDLAEHASPPVRAAVARAIGKHATLLASVAESPTRSVLGHAIYAIARPPLMPLEDDTLTALATIHRREDGWPRSVALGLLADYARFSDQLIPTLDRASDDELASLIHSFTSTGDNTVTQEGFERIGREASPVLRGRVAAAVKSSVDDLGRARALMKQMGIQPTRQFDPPDVEWARYAARLGVAP